MGRTRHVSKGPHLYRRNGVYWAYVDHDHRYSLETRNPTEAKAKFEDARKRAERARLARGAPGETPLAMIAKQYMDAPHGWSKRTRHTNRLRVIAFVEAMHARGTMVASLITPSMLDSWRDSRMKLSRHTINRDEMVARGMLAWAVKRALTPSNPLAGQKPLKQPSRGATAVIPSPGEVKAVIRAMEALGEHGAALTVSAAVLTGQRLDELRHLGPADIAHGVVSVTPQEGGADEAWQSKSYRKRDVPIGEAAEKLVLEFVEWKSGSGGRGKPIGIADSWIAQKIDAGCARADVPVFRMHDLRRTFATNAIRHGIAITVVRGWLGHRDVGTTERYIGRYRSDALERVPVSALLDVLGDEK
jgi:integrase